jgi:hypothetical protein
MKGMKAPCRLNDRRRFGYRGRARRAGAGQSGRKGGQRACAITTTFSAKTALSKRKFSRGPPARSILGVCDWRAARIIAMDLPYEFALLWHFSVVTSLLWATIFLLYFLHRIGHPFLIFNSLGYCHGDIQKTELCLLRNIVHLSAP